MQLLLIVPFRERIAEYRRAVDEKARRGNYSCFKPCFSVALVKGNRLKCIRNAWATTGVKGSVSFSIYILRETEYLITI